MPTNTITEQQANLNSSHLRRHIDRILCPIDLSPDSNQSLSYAAALSKAYGTKLYICYCVPALPPDGFLNPKDVIEDFINHHTGSEYLRRLDWEGIVVKGSAADMILHEANARQASLIVMHSRRRPLRAAVLGSTTEKICRCAPCPVLVIHSDEREWLDFSTGELQLKRLLIAHDFSDHADLALSYALSLAQEFQTELHLLHVRQIRLEHTWYPPADEESKQASERLHKAVPVETRLWCNIQWSVREGEPYKEILNYAQERNIDLICIGEHGKGFGKWSPFGSNVDWVLRHAPCPVLVARPVTANGFSH
ncbi:MAG: universal stress protein [Acidobacteriota bacterium]